MPLDDAIRAAAEDYGVQQKYWDIFGEPHTTTAATNRAILTAVGIDCASEESLSASAARREAAAWRRVLPPVLVVKENSNPIPIPVRIPGAQAGLDLEIIREDGKKQTHFADLWAVAPKSRFILDGVEFVERPVPLPAALPLGYHEVRAGGCTMRLIVAPESAYGGNPAKRAGLGVTLYGLRSERNWGCGDFRDLRDLIDWAVPALHADFIALNPLHAIQNRTPYNASPYLPNSIFYRNFLYLDVEGIPGYVEDPGERGEIARLRATTFVEYEKVAALKRRALERIFLNHPPDAACQDWIAREGDLLRLYATYCALDEHLHAAHPHLWIWPEWPAEYRDPSHPAVAEFARANQRAILFHSWLQWLIDRQIAAVQQHARDAGMGIGLYHDLALATDRAGSDLWAHRPFFVNGARVGAPPDGFAPLGQDWSFPPPNEERHREDGYRLYIESIRKTMRHGGALRIDHVMRLFRLYWIPEGHDATEGAYVKDRPEDLVSILELESVRNRALIVGEDLGTVEQAVRQSLAAAGILSYRLLIFEKNAKGFRAPTDYPPQALTSTTTHDLPTMAGFWTGEDIETRLRTGTIDQESYQSQKADRVTDRQHLLDALFEARLLPQNYIRHAALIPTLTPELHHAIMGFLAGTPAQLWLVNQEDLTCERYQQNMPGTTSEYPNWSRKMRWQIGELSALPEARDSVAMIRHWIADAGRA